MTEEITVVPDCYGRKKQTKERCGECPETVRTHCRESYKCVTKGKGYLERCSFEDRILVDELYTLPRSAELPSGKKISSFVTFRRLCSWFGNRKPREVRVIHQRLWDGIHDPAEIARRIGLKKGSLSNILSGETCMAQLFRDPAPADADAPIRHTDTVYLAGPMTGMEDFNFRSFDTVELYVATHFGPAWIINPQINRLLIGENRPHEDYMALARIEVGLSDVVVFLPDWEKSKGACEEHELAVKLGKRIIAINPEK